MMGFLDVFNWRDVASVSCCSDFARQPLEEDEPTKDEGPLELDRSNLVGDRPPFSKSHGVPSLSEKGRHDSRARAPGWSFRPHPDRWASSRNADPGLDTLPVPERRDFGTL